jgi:hypothetical protein
MNKLTPFIQRISDGFCVYWIIIQEISTKYEKYWQDGVPVPEGWKRIK